MRIFWLLKNGVNNNINNNSKVLVNQIKPIVNRQMSNMHVLLVFVCLCSAFARRLQWELALRVYGFTSSTGLLDVAGGGPQPPPDPIDLLSS